ncbi:hypothetical protein ACHAXT_003057 [Thalassiosira profunda]
MAADRLQIRVLHSDDDIVVIDKPCDLRSVPGHANPPPPEKQGPRRQEGASVDGAGESSQRRTAQEAWVKAIQLISAGEGEGNAVELSAGCNGDDGPSVEEAAARELLRNLGTTANPSCVPRKLETFVKYCRRNTKRLIPSFPELQEGKAASKERRSEPEQKKQKRDISCEQNGNRQSVASTMKAIAEMAYVEIQQKQRPLINLPKPTEDWESAIGQLRMLGFGDFSPVSSTIAKNSATSHGDSKLHVVHRLDCQTSGIMVVARNQSAASTLCQKWREREDVKKVYLAHVIDWPPYHQQNVTEGTIEIPLAPSRTERIKWEARAVAEGGKECKTYWKVHEDLDRSKSNSDAPKSKRGITLELHPITGRTHQLRIHCASVGSGIVGDSLYGDAPIEWSGDTKTKANETQGVVKQGEATILSKTLRLHAHRLTFPHPTSQEGMTFESRKPW